MWNIFEENSQPYVDSAKVRWLFQQVKSSDSAVTLCIASLKNDNRKPGEQPVSYSEAADAIAAAISESNPGKLRRSAGSVTSAITSGSKGSATPTDKAPAKVDYFTTAEWNKFSAAKKDSIRKKRDKHGLPGGTRKSSGNASGSVAGSTPSRAPTESQSKPLSWKDRRQAKAIAATEERMAAALGTALIKAAASNASVVSEITDNAGAAFGGQNEVHRQRQT
jgi:hypothetical protein